MKRDQVEFSKLLVGQELFHMGPIERSCVKSKNIGEAKFQRLDKVCSVFDV